MANCFFKIWVEKTRKKFNFSSNHFFNAWNGLGTPKNDGIDVKSFKFEPQEPFLAFWHFWGQKRKSKKWSKWMMESFNGTNYASNQSGIPILVGLDTKIFKIAPSSPKLEPLFYCINCETCSMENTCCNSGPFWLIFKLFGPDPFSIESGSFNNRHLDTKSLKIGPEKPKLWHILCVEMVSHGWKHKNGHNFGLDRAILKILVSDPTKIGMLDWLEA